MHPIVAQLSPNSEQEPAITARGRDIVVTAGAGTGKTLTLVARYLSLLADGIPLRSIVAITFTRKAAREMRNRVRGEMRKYLDRQDLDPGERTRWDELYNQLDAARIGTIHNLCTEILRAHPAEADIDPRFEVLDEGQAGIFLAQAVDEALAWAVDDTQAVQLFALLGERSLRETLEKLLTRRLEARETFARLTTSPWPIWEARLSRMIRTFTEDGMVRGSFADLRVLRQDGTLDRAEAAGDRLAEPLRELLRLWDEVEKAQAEGDWEAVSARLKPLRSNMKIVGSGANWSPADPKSAIRELQHLYDDLLAPWVSGGINLELDRQIADYMPAIQRLFSIALAAYDRLKQDGQSLDFDDLEQRATSLLKEYQAVRTRWQRDISALLVDEYQDTNRRQRDLINLINGGDGKLFIVGDAKQSIYRFRGAEVAVFRGERARIEAEGGDSYTLSTSYRAHRGLIDALNALLRPVLGEEDDPDRPWREPFAPLAPFRETPLPGIEPPFTALRLTVGSKSEGALDRAARAVAEILVELVEKDDSELNYGDVAILCRASTSFGAYEDALDEAGVPYLTAAGRGFYERPEIRDLLNALKTLADPTDDLALAGLLRSPVIAFSDLDLFALCRHWRERDHLRPLWQTLQNWPGERAARAVDLITRLHNAVGRTPVAALLKAFLDETDYRAALISAGYPRAARNASKLLNDAHTSNIVGVEEFLEYVNALQSGVVREGEARATAGDVVQIMSVHAAKGLEFPLVVIGDAGHQGPNRSEIIFDEEAGLLLPLKDEEGNMPALYRLASAGESDQEDAESERLLYVAATRAKDYLLLNGTIRLTTGRRPGYLRGWLKRLAGPAGLTERVVDYNEEGERAIGLDLQVGSVPVSCTIYEPGYARAFQAKEAKAAAVRDETWDPRLLAPLTAEVDEEERVWPDQEDESVLRVWRVVPDRTSRHAPSWIVGRLVHKALECWRFPDEHFDRWIAEQARSVGLVDRRQLKDAQDQARRLMIRFQKHHLYREMDQARRLHEVPYTLITPGGELDQGFIDCLFRRDGKWTIVEFKTDWVADEGDFARLLEITTYAQQVRRYILAVEQLLGQKPRALLCMLNFGGNVRPVPIDPQP